MSARPAGREVDQQGEPLALVEGILGRAPATRRHAARRRRKTPMTAARTQTSMRSSPCRLLRKLTRSAGRARKQRLTGDLDQPGASRGTTDADHSRGNAVLEKGQPQRFNAYNSAARRSARVHRARRARPARSCASRAPTGSSKWARSAEIVNHARPEPPAILFEDVPGYPEGHAAPLRRDQLVEAARDHARPAGAVQSARRGARLSRPHEGASADPAARPWRRARCSRTSTATTRSTC